MSLNEKAYEQLWKIYCELGEQERHFNSIQSNYRALASTWMLAAFAGTGFVISKDLALTFPKEFIIGAIGTAGCIGVFLLCIIDLLFFQRLLDASYIEGRSLEEAQPWLPQIRNNSRGLLKGKGLRLITLFYTSGTITMGCVGAFGIVTGMSRVTTARFIVPAVLAYMSIVLGVALLVRHKTSTTLELEEKLMPSRVHSYQTYKIPETPSPIQGDTVAAAPNKKLSGDAPQPSE